jgi:hypothetical protein
MLMMAQLIEKQNENKLLIDNYRDFYQCDVNGQLKKKQKKTKSQRKAKTMDKLKPKNEVVVVKSDEVLNLRELHDLSLTHLDLTVPQVRTMYESLFRHINQCYLTTFTLSEIQIDNESENQLVFHSHCVFKPEDANERVVTAYVNSNGFVFINCYHESCQAQSRSAPLTIDINKSVFAYADAYTVLEGTVVVENIEDAFGEFSGDH